MTKETILTIEDIRIAALAAGCQLNVDDGALALHLSRAIEQAILQSPEIQVLQKDAERYRWLSLGVIENVAVVQGLDTIDRVASTYSVELVEEELDEVIDATMDQQA